VEGCWVLEPPGGVDAAHGVVHFVGGAFVGASPQVSYRLFLEALAAEGFVVVATPFALGFDYVSLSDSCHRRFSRALAASQRPALRALPQFGVGHSLGTVLHLLAGVRQPLGPERVGNVFLSFNCKPATEAIPSFGPASPALQAAFPLLETLREQNPLAGDLDRLQGELRAAAPAQVRELLPVVDQLEPLLADVAAGRREFQPAPAEVRRLVRARYGVARNLLVRFRNDSIDETSELSQLLQGSGSAVGPVLDLSVRALPGDHVRPLRPEVPDLPEELRGAAAQGSEALDAGIGLLSTLGGPGAKPLADIAGAVKGGLDEVLEAEGGGSAAADAAELAAELAGWMRAGARAHQALSGAGG